MIYHGHLAEISISFECVQRFLLIFFLPLSIMSHEGSGMGVGGGADWMHCSMMIRNAANKALNFLCYLSIRSLDGAAGPPPILCTWAAVQPSMTQGRGGSYLFWLYYAPVYTPLCLLYYTVIISCAGMLGHLNKCYKRSKKEEENTYLIICSAW